jgi:hypothetical protein
MRFYIGQLFISLFFLKELSHQYLLFIFTFWKEDLEKFI